MEKDCLKFFKTDISNLDELKKSFKESDIDAVINLAARAGVRASVEDPWVYVDTNVTGTLNLLELCREFEVKKFILASTSSAYGTNEIPFSEEDRTDDPLSPYAATKKGAEVLCHTYHYLYDVDTTVLRYFTVYGPAGRPDMSIFRFIKQIHKGRPIEVFGDGKQKRDFTYVDDIAEGTIKALKPVKYEIINLGNNSPVELMYAIKLIEQNLGKKAKINFLPRHKADVLATSADIKKAKRILDWEPKMKIEEGIKRTVEWHLKNEKWL
jgi:nucleoside-diphosphate-sugar epimerase